MNIATFLAHYQVTENPFGAEEARLDPVFDRLADHSPTHPDFPKILGRIDQPSTSVVFGEKGSGKTAIRLLIGKHVAEHNAQNPDRRVLAVAYDDFNPILDNLLRAKKQNASAVLERFRLESHQDAILSLAVTKLVDALLGGTGDGDEPVPLPADADHRLRSLARPDRVDLAVLAALYDQPSAGSAFARWQRLRKKLRLGWRLPISAARLFATLLSIVTVGLLVAYLVMRGDSEPGWLLPLLAVSAAASIVQWGYWLWQHGRTWWLCRTIRRQMPALNRNLGDLRRMLGQFSRGELSRQPFPLPTPGNVERDTRYQLTRRLIDLIGALGYVGMIVLVDRVDEPTVISGHTDRMKAIVWPLLDNKFLQQKRVGIKLLLPIELRHAVHRATSEFFQEARLDKQSLIDRLEWSGATLYDLCSSRLRACRPAEADPISLTDLFEEGLSRETLIDALDQMHQPRDAFKFLYGVIQEHCRLVPEEQPQFSIARLTLESVRRSHSQRVQELYRGLTPA
jgi:hypothetical protein